MLSRGYLPGPVNSHATIIEFMRDSLGPLAVELLLRFDRMRRKRHGFLYDSLNSTTDKEALEAVRTAQDFIRTIRDLTQTRDSRDGGSIS